MDIIGACMIIVSIVIYMYAWNSERKSINAMKQDVKGADISPEYVEGEIASLYLKMQDKHFQNEGFLKKCKIISALLFVIGLVLLFFNYFMPI